MSRFNRNRRARTKGRSGYIPYLVIASILLFLETVNPGVPRQIRAYAGDIVSPVLSLLEQPIRGLQSGLERLAGVSDIYLENQDLRDENDRLRQWRDAALSLSSENERLRRILRAPGREITPAGTGRVIGVGGGAFERSVIVDLGSRDKIRRNLPVVDDAGVVGRVIYTGYLTSRVLLVTDLNSRVPVRVDGSGQLGMVEGQNEAFMRLTYLPKDYRPSVGDRILTSGHGGSFPPDVPIGRVISVEGDIVLVDPVGLLDRLDFVKILDYRPPPPEAEPFDAPETVPGIEDALVSEGGEG